MAFFNREVLTEKGFSDEQITYIMATTRAKLGDYITKAEMADEIARVKAEHEEQGKQTAAATATAEAALRAELDKLTSERDMLRAIGGDDFSTVKPKFRETVFGMLDRSEGASPIPDQLKGISEKYEEYFTASTPDEPKNTPQYSKQPVYTGTNATSPEDALLEQIRDAWK